MNSRRNVSRFSFHLLVLATVGFCAPVIAQTSVTVSSLADLRYEASTRNNSTITLAPGDYWIDGDHIANPTNSEPTFLELTGTNNTYNLAGTHLKLDTRKLDGFGRALGHDSGIEVVKISGTNNTVNDLRITGYDLDLVNDPNAQRHADWAGVYVQLTGTDNTVQGADILTRGSSPYGLGDAFGKGARVSPQGLPVEEGGLPWVGHNKTSAFQVTEAQGAVIDDMHLDVRTYGHGFFVQGSDDTTLTNSTVTGQLFPSTNVSTHPKYIEYGGVTKDGNPIPENIFISGAEDGVRMYTGASNLTVDNVVVTNMRSGFAVALGSGNMILNNVETYGAEHGFDFRRNTTITNAKGDIVNGPLIWVPYSNTANSSIDVELVGGAPFHDWGAAFFSGVEVDVNITSNIPANIMGDFAVIRIGQRWWNDWRDHDDLDSFEEDAWDYADSIFANDTNLMLAIGEDVEDNVGRSTGYVLSNGKNNFYDGQTLVLAGTRLEVSQANGLGNSGTEAGAQFSGSSIVYTGTVTGQTFDDNASFVQDGATLEVNPGITITDEKLTITGDGVDGKGALYSDGQTGTGTRFGSSNSSDESTIFLDGDASIGVGIAGNQMLVGRIQGTGNLTKRGAGILAMEKSSAYDGNLIVAEGRVVARSGVVLRDLNVATGASISAISSNAFNTQGDVELNGTLDINGRNSSFISNLSSTIGRLSGSGRLTSSNPTNGSGGIVTLGSSSDDGLFTGQIDGAVNLMKAGINNQVFSGLLFHTGTTTVTEGGLFIDGTHTGGGPYTVLGGTLGGSGTIDSAVTVHSGGIIELGDTTGSFSADSAEFQNGSQLNVDIDSRFDFDQLLLDGALTIDSGSTLNLNIENGYAPNVGEEFKIIDFGSSQGMFGTILTSDPGIQWDLSRFQSEGIISVLSNDSAVLLGDCNLDGVVDFLDIAYFISSLSSANFLDQADTNQDGYMNFLDIGPFITILSGT